MGLYDITIINAIGGNKLSFDKQRTEMRAGTEYSLENEYSLLVIYSLNRNQKWNLQDCYQISGFVLDSSIPHDLFTIETSGRGCLTKVPNMLRTNKWFEKEMAANMYSDYERSSSVAPSPPAYSLPIRLS